MTLHDAITQVLFQHNKPLSASEIAGFLNRTQWYVKKDGSEIKSSQISARVGKHQNLFNNSNGLISLKSKSGIVPIKPVKKVLQKSIQSIQHIQEDTSLLKKVLMNEKNFKTITSCEHQIPDSPGLYCIRIADIKSFKKPFSDILNERNHNIVYIGVASKSLRRRFLGQELRAKGHGTFFRSLGAVLGYFPIPGSLANKANQNNYRFSPTDEVKIIEWINKNLLINWVTLKESWNQTEGELLQQYSPLLNIAGNPGALREVVELRNECKRVARGAV